MFNRNILSIFCASLMQIDPVIPEITRVTNASFLDKTAKIGISHRISQQLIIGCVATSAVADYL